MPQPTFLQVAQLADALRPGPAKALYLQVRVDIVAATLQATTVLHARLLPAPGWRAFSQPHPQRVQALRDAEGDRISP